MRKISLLVITLYTMILAGAQESDLSAIKLFLSQDSIVSNNRNLPDNVPNRLYSKIVQIVNQTGFAEVGYSNFWVMPKFDVLSVSATQSGVSKVWLAECELFITVSRRNYSGSGGTTYNSYSKAFMGSGDTEKEAIANAVNSISPKDKKIADFFDETRKKIDAYFKNPARCKETLQEAAQATRLGDYGRSIALYFSVPASSPCYQNAKDSSILVYSKYMGETCNRELVQLKAYVATIQTGEGISIEAFNHVLYIINNMSPSSRACYAEAKLEIEKIEKRFTTAQQNKWEAEKKRAANDAEIEKERAKAMGKINSTYQPAPVSTTTNNNTQSTIIVK